MTTAVIGATGRVGSEIVRGVLARGPVYQPLSARTWTWVPGTLIMRHMTRACW